MPKKRDKWHYISRTYRYWKKYSALDKRRAIGSSAYKIIALHRMLIREGEPAILAPGVLAALEMIGKYANEGKE